MASARYSISSPIVVAFFKLQVTVHRNPDLMQASQGGAIGTVSLAYQVFEMQDDSLQVVKIVGEGVQRLGLDARLDNGIANLRRKAADVLRVVTIFRTTEVGAAAR